jgi:hypothetical protein
MIRSPCVNNLPVFDREESTLQKEELLLKRTPHVLQLDEDRLVYSYCDLHVIPEDYERCEMYYSIQSSKNLLRRQKIIRRQRNKARSAFDFNTVLVNTWDPRYTHHAVNFEEEYENEERQLRRNRDGTKNCGSKANAGKRKHKKSNSCPSILETVVADFTGLLDKVFDDEARDETKRELDLGQFGNVQ